MYKMLLYIHRDNKIKICDKIKVDLPQMGMTKTAVTYLHKHLVHRKCNSVIKQLKITMRKATVPNQIIFNFNQL